MAVRLIQGKQITGNLTGSFTGSFTGNGSGLTNLPVQGFSTGSFVTTSSFNSFTSSYNTGSFTGSFTGSLFGTASFSVSSSIAVTSSFAISSNNVIGYSAATIEQINIGETNNGTYAYIIRAEELEQSKHSTINIFNTLNFI